MIRVRPGTLWLACFAVMALLLVGCGEKQEPAAPSEAAGGGDARGAVAPPPDARWQYQLEASPERADDSSGRIDVDICRRPASGGECVRPRVIDFDLYLDRRGTDDDSTLNRAGVDALHARGGYAVCYVDAGSAELFRPDFPRFRRWHRSHGRSLLGNPFSRRFPDERWINIGARKQRRFVLGVMEERTVKCARAGFDAVEYDVVEAWSAGRRTTGGRPAGTSPTAIS